MTVVQLSCKYAVAVLLVGLASLRAASGERVAVATIAPLASLTAMVAGDGWVLRTIVPPGVSPHVFEPTPREVRAIAQALLVVTVGAGYDGWAEKLVRACASRAVVHDAGASIGVTGVASEEHEGEIGKDPHWWLSPRLAARTLAPLAERLAAIDPAGTEGYRARARQGEANLARLDEEISALLLPLKGRPVVSAHNAWSYFLSEYGLVNGGSVEPVPGREPSPRELKELVDLARARGLRAIFAETQFPLAAINVIAQDTRLRVVTVDPEGGVAGRSGYLDLMRFNARSFRDGLGVR